MSLFRTQHVATAIEAETAMAGEHTLKRVLTARHLVMLGIGAVIGAGIFVMTGNAAANYAGPAIILSFVMAGICLRLRGSLLRGIRGHAAGLGQRLFLCLRDARRSWSHGSSAGC